MLVPRSCIERDEKDVSEDGKYYTHIWLTSNHAAISYTAISLVFFRNHELKLDDCLRTWNQLEVQYLLKNYVTHLTREHRVILSTRLLKVHRELVGTWFDAFELHYCKHNNHASRKLGQSIDMQATKIGSIEQLYHIIGIGHVHLNMNVM